MTDVERLGRTIAEYFIDLGFAPASMADELAEAIAREYDQPKEPEPDPPA